MNKALIGCGIALAAFVLFGCIGGGGGVTWSGINCDTAYGPDMQEGKGSCYGGAALDRGSDAVCGTLTDQTAKDQCYFIYALGGSTGTTHPASCANIVNADKKATCTAATAPS